MNRHPSEAAQDQRTEFWGNLRDKKLEKYYEILIGMSFLKPIDAFKKRRELHDIGRFVMRATIIIKESRDQDREIQEFHEQ